ncbi:MAG: HTTM domain-containing protein [Acidobacteria bacterium]|nr:HTTM domain-containing protein [Acidobacteriota bacterium]
MNAFVKFLGERTDARPLAVARIVIGGVAFLRALVSYHLFDRVLISGVVRAREYEWVPDMTRAAMPWYTGVWLLVAAAFALGYRTRLSGTILFGLIVYHLAAGQSFFWSHIYFLGCLVLLLTVADAGADLSRDWMSRGGGRRTVPRWGVALLKLHITIVYGFAAIAKLNPEFLSGAVLERALLRPEFLKTPEIVVALAWSSVAFEGCMAIALWMKPLRSWAIVAGVLFHAAIPVSIGLTGGLVVFSASIVGTYVLFLDREEFAAAESFVLRALDAIGFRRARMFLASPRN